MTLKAALALAEFLARPGTRKYADRQRRKFSYANFDNLTEEEIQAWFIGNYMGHMEGVKEGHRFALIDVAKALSDSGRSQTETAALLGISQSTAHRILKEPTATEVLKSRREQYESD